jgi:hypothetical protein
MSVNFYTSISRARLKLNYGLHFPFSYNYVRYFVKDNVNELLFFRQQIFIWLKIAKLISYLYRFFFFSSLGNSDKCVCSYLLQYIISYFFSISHYYFHRHSFLCLTLSVSSFYIQLFCRLHNHTISACLFNTFSSLCY